MIEQHPYLFLAIFFWGTLIGTVIIKYFFDFISSFKKPKIEQYFYVVSKDLDEEFLKKLSEHSAKKVSEMK